MKNVVNFYANINNLFVIRSTTFIQLKLFDYVFRTWHYVIVMLKLNKRLKIVKICLNIECIMSIINRKFLLTQLLNCVIRFTLTFVIVHNIKIIQHVFLNFALFDLWIFEQDLNESIIAQIIRKIYIIDNLRVNILIKMNIQALKKIIINISRRQLTAINYVKFTIFIEIISTSKRINRIFKNKKSIFLLFYFVINVFV